MTETVNKKRYLTAVQIDVELLSRMILVKLNRKKNLSRRSGNVRGDRKRFHRANVRKLLGSSETLTAEIRTGVKKNNAL